MATPALAAGPAPTEGCTWKQHSKRVAKRVRRHGQWRRVKRLKHWWTCEAPPTPNALTSQPTLPTSPTPEPPPLTEPEVGHLGVKAVEYSYTLSRPEVSAGEVIVELNNQGEDPHNLVLEHEGTEDPDLEVASTPSLAQTSAHFTLSPGTYRLYCSLYKHEAKGMQATLVVSGS
ncbi:MAG TPA: plastocyanin/azurin family copper-binding protein [Solirubrobacterales bacterium]|nr:plastocyanin/azurin family copper-binding protein [Solirubrobacterales bacterium]